MEDRSLPRTVKKRDGSIVPFNAEKIRYAVERAAFEVRQDRKAAVAVAAQVTEAVLKTLTARYQGGVPSVEAIQDTIEKALMEAGYAEIARAYILYRQRRTEIRLAKSALGQKDDLKLPINTMEVLKRRYLLKDDRRTSSKPRVSCFGAWLPILPKRKSTLNPPSPPRRPKSDSIS